MKIIIVLILGIGLFSCNQRTDEGYQLKANDKKLVFELDNQTKSNPKTLFLYKDKTGKEYLTFQNGHKNEILFYDLKTQDFMFKVTPDLDGNNGVGMFLGYYIMNLDSILLTNSDIEEIAIVDTANCLKEQLVYEKTIDSVPLNKSYSLTDYYRPIQEIGNKFYLISRGDRRSKINPVSITIDKETKEVNYLPFFYPQLPIEINKAKVWGAEDYFSREFDGKRFIYSFYFDEDIYVTSIDHKSVERRKVKSRYLNKVRLLDDFGQHTFQDICENAEYGSLIYDSYRKVYYRIVHLKTEIGRKLNDREALELIKYGRKNFSIIIMDENLNVIGETLFPDYTYNCNVMFVHKDGLYISASHAFNENYTDDNLIFHCFELVK